MSLAFAIWIPRSLDPCTLRGRVTLILNGTLVILLGLFLLIDFRRDFADRLALKRTALDEQARLIEPGIAGKAASGSDSLQRLLRATHDRMNNDHHSEHWIAVHTPQGWYSTGIPDREAASIVSSLNKVSRGEQNLQHAFAGRFVVGKHAGAEVEVCVAETYQEVRAAIGADLRRHLWGVGIILLVGIVTLNLVMSVGLLAPLTTFVATARAIGQGDFRRHISTIGMQELDVLAAAFNGMSVQLAEVEQTRAAQMHTARLIQEHLLPKAVSIKGVEVAYLFEPTEVVGGDYFDAVTLPDGGSLIAIADASGHGVPAALVAAIVKVLLLDAVEHLSDPAEIVQSIDQRMTGLSIPEAFVTMLIVRIYPEAGHVEYASAGHISAWIVDGESNCHAMPSTGPILGAGIDLSWQTERIRFSQGSRMVLLTDGVIEASGPTGEAFGESRLCEALRKTHSSTTKNLPPAIYEQLRRHTKGVELLDDITLIVVDCLPMRGDVPTNCNET